MAGASASPGDSQSPSQSSGRRVKHSRHGCVSCKERRLRCSEERPVCSRCLDDGRSCEYVLRLIWEDESSRRGVKHGRGKNAEISFVDPTPSKDVAEKAQWRPRRNGRSYFLNTIPEDMDAAQSMAVMRFDGRYKSMPRLHVPQTLGLSNVDRILFQYYQVQVCRNLTLVDDSSNCYRQIILPLSISYECVKRSILAIGALYLSLNQPSVLVDYYSLALHQKQRTLHQLRYDIASLNGASSNHVLVAMLMLCLFDITDDCQTSWSTHVSAAADLIGTEDTQSLEPSLVSFVSKFFATRDVMGRSACGARSKFRKIAWNNPQEIDKSAGCSSELLGIISSITDISRQMAENMENDSPHLVRQVITIESQLDELIQLLPTDSALNSEQEAFLVQTSALVHNAAKLYFYTALHSALPSTLIVRRLIADQVLVITGIPILRSAHLWSVFVTALYAFNDEERIFFLEQFDKLEEVSATRSSTQAARSIVQTVWKKRDLDVDGEQVTESGVSDWVRFVRPMSEGLSLA
ncbi:uncharacterized protein LY89DRAFT_189135 [Mollisia scopiformis]|uniref:Zn(2)-C6 fungal-type domain-containing protein n=1 Tax=Mollisia scopiformis TaxID=149040 RepID=A0A194XVA3_MOLSC|nr:uncharacterized protein LY89DRAFT_189135 [Mollisia scopiformis]KUJ23642.1 hypothetical protein LY89DRAFT_189135 [Mollisia scopiformis]